MLIVSGFGRGEVDSDGYSADQTEAMTWIQAITGITVGDTAYTRTSSYPYDADTYYLGSSSPLFMLNRSGLGGYPAVGTTTYTVTVTAAGYKTAHLTVAVTNSGYSISAQVTGVE